MLGKFQAWQFDNIIYKIIWQLMQEVYLALIIFKQNNTIQTDRIIQSGPNVKQYLQ